MTIPEINKEQVEMMKKFARSKVKTSVAFTSIPSDGADRIHIEKDLLDKLELLEIGLLSDITEMPAYKNVVDHYKEHDGREAVFVLRLTALGEAMFKKVCGDKWVN